MSMGIVTNNAPKDNWYPAGALWPAILAALRGQMTQSTFDSVFGGSHADLADETLTIYPGSEKAGEWMEKRWADHIGKASAQILGYRPDLTFASKDAPELAPTPTAEDDARPGPADSQAVIERMHRINITGNVIPDNWFKWLTYESGRPHLIAAVILSEVVYFYRPRVVKDEQTGVVLALQKRFAGHKLQRSYGQFKEKFGISKQQARDGIAKLVELGTITKEVKEKLVLEDGRVLSNVMYLEVVPEMIETMTFDDPL